MARIKLLLPEKFYYKTEIPIRISDINYGGHLGNDSVLSIVHEARIRFLQTLGYTELNIEETSITMTDAIICYTAEGFYGDILEVEVGVIDIQTATCDFVFRIINKTAKKEIARVKTGVAFLNGQTRKIASIPEVFRNKIGSLI